MRLGAQFDGVLYPIGVDRFGAESDIDANGVVVVLLTDGRPTSGHLTEAVVRAADEGVRPTTSSRRLTGATSSARPNRRIPGA